jgi:hypothetical protein
MPYAPLARRVTHANQTCIDETTDLEGGRSFVRPLANHVANFYFWPFISRSFLFLSIEKNE